MSRLLGPNFPPSEAAYQVVAAGGMSHVIEIVNRLKPGAVALSEIQLRFGLQDVGAAGQLMIAAQRAIEAGETYRGAPAGYTPPADVIPWSGKVSTGNYHTVIAVEFWDPIAQTYVHKGIANDSDHLLTPEEIADLVSDNIGDWSEDYYFGTTIDPDSITIKVTSVVKG